MVDWPRAVFEVNYFAKQPWPARTRRGLMFHVSWNCWDSGKASKVLTCPIYLGYSQHIKVFNSGIKDLKNNRVNLPGNTLNIILSGQNDLITTLCFSLWS